MRPARGGGGCCLPSTAVSYASKAHFTATKAVGASVFWPFTPKGRSTMNARSALLLLLGLVIGVLGTVFAMKALGNRNPMPHAVMTVMGHHMGALGQAVKTRQCDAAQVNDHLLRLQSTASDIPV